MDLASLDKMKVVDLRNELQTRGLDTKGVKAVLVERLRAYLEGGGVPPSPGTPGRRSRRTRSMTKSPSPSPVKKAPEPTLETLEEESSAPNALAEEEVNKEKFSTPEKTAEKPIEEAEADNDNNSRNQENYESTEENNQEEDEQEQANGSDEAVAISNDEDAPKSISENKELVTENDNVKDVEENKSLEEEKEINHSGDVDKAKDHPGSSPKIINSPKERSRSQSADRCERQSRSHSDSRSRSRSHSRTLRHKSKSHSRSRTRSRSPKRRSGGGSLGSPLKEGEDTSTPEDEPTLEENQFGLSWFDSDLHLRIDPVTFTSAKPMSHDIYALVWSGARTNYGVSEGKVCFEVRLSEETNLSRDHPFRNEPYTKGFRVGFSTISSNLLLGESNNSFAYCESGRKATNGEFAEFGKPFHLDDVIGCYLDLESEPCTIKYTLNGEDLGTAFEFDKATLGENQALFPHVLTKGYEYEINLADNDNLLVNLERKVRKRRKVKKIEEKKEEIEKNKEEEAKKDKHCEEDKNVKDSKEEKTEDAKNEEQLQENSESQEKNVEEEDKPGLDVENEEKQSKQEDIEMCEEPHKDEKSEEKNTTGQEENKSSSEDGTKVEDSVVTTKVEKEHIEKEKDEKSNKNKDDCGPSPSKRQKMEATEEEDEYEEIYPVPREIMSLLPEYELIALIPEEKYIPGPQRPESRKDCEVILMIGLPGAGKTTWVLNHIKENPDKRYHVIGADALIAKMTIDGAPRKSVHKGRFDRIYELCFNVLTSLEDIAVKRRRNFILDQANAYASAQRRKMKGFGDFKRIAVVCIPNEEELKRRLADKKEKGHAYSLKESTLNTLQAAFTLPSLEFGWFDDIIYTDLGMEEAKEEVKKYNEKGKKALDENHSNRDKRPRRDNYRNDNRRRQDDRRRYDNRNDSRWNDRRAGGGGGYNHGGGGGGGGANRWGGGGGGYRNNSGGHRDDRGYGGGSGRGYDNRNQRFNSGPQNWVQNNRNRYDDRSNRYNSGGSGRYDSYGGGSRDYRGGGGGGGDHRDHRDRNRSGSGGGAGSNNNRRDGGGHRSGGSSNQRDFRHGHRDIREDSRGGSSATSATATSSTYKSSAVASGNNDGYDKYNKNQPQANNWIQGHQHQTGPVGQQQQQQYWNYDMQGYGSQQQWQSMDPQQQQQWMAWWQQQGGAQQAAAGGSSLDPNQYWSQYSYSTPTDATKK